MILQEDDHSANYGQIPVVDFLMWALLMIYRDSITVAEKHLLETGLGPPIHFTQATEASKMFSCLISNPSQSYLVSFKSVFLISLLWVQKGCLQIL